LGKTSGLERLNGEAHLLRRADSWCEGTIPKLTLRPPVAWSRISPTVATETEMTTLPQDIVDAFPEFSVDARPLGAGTFKVAHRIEVGGEKHVLKVVLQPIDDPDAALPERLRREIEAMSRIDSPRVVRIVQGPEIREIGGDHHVCYQEPFFPGGTLDARLPGPLSPANTLRMTRGLLEGVNALWGEQGLVHRDIKPANIAFDDNDEPVLLDLGIAYHAGVTPLTEPFGQSPRTPAYAAPEQFEVRRMAQIDFRTDLFLVGVVCLEALTGRHPYDPFGDPHGYMKRLFDGTFNRAPLDAVDNEAALKASLTRMIRPYPNQRFRSVQQALTSLPEVSQ